jgi:hypothetical protein
MAILMRMEVPEWTQEHYDRLAGEVTPDGKLPAGCLTHVSAPLPSGGWQVVDVWESREAMDRFTTEKIMPAAQRLGIPQPATAPQVTDIHKLIKS